MDERWTMLTVRQVAKELNIHANTVRRWADLGILRCYRIGDSKHRRFREEDVAVILIEDGKAADDARQKVYARIDKELTLTKRERQVLKLAGKRLSNGQIGARLGIVEQTVKNMMSSAIRKLDATDRTDAVLKALDLNLIKRNP